MLTCTLALTVDIPQLEALRATIAQIGEQLVLNLTELRAVVTELSAGLDHHLTELEALMQSDVRDQQAIDEVVAALRGEQQRLADAIPDMPTEPEPAPTPEP